MYVCMFEYTHIHVYIHIYICTYTFAREFRVMDGLQERMFRVMDGLQERMHACLHAHATCSKCVSARTHTYTRTHVHA